MKIYWWQAGLHIEPEADDERDFLVKLTDMLDRTDFSFQIPSSPVDTVNAVD